MEVMDYQYCKNIPARVLRDIIVFAEQHAVQKIILFGSRARGTHGERSDVDLAVQGGNFDAFYWDMKEKAHTLLSFDLVELDDTISEELKMEIERDGVVLYEKLDNFVRSLSVLQNAKFDFAYEDEIYRTGVVGQYNLTFELAWKALQGVLRIHGVAGVENGSPREILQLGYKHGFLNDPEVWLIMLKKRNTSVHIYDEDKIDELLLLIRDSFIFAFHELEIVLKEKMQDMGDEQEVFE